MSKKHITIPIFIPHMGCPFRCIFCNQRHSSGARSLPGKTEIFNRVRNFIKNIPRTVEHIEIAFFGGSFTGIDPALQEDLLSAANFFLGTGRIKGIRLSTRPDYIDAEKLTLLKKYNVSTIELGVQSFSDSVLEASGRGHSRDDSLRAIEIIKKSGFNCVIQLMPGFPRDSREKSIRSALTASEMKPLIRSRRPIN